MEIFSILGEGLRGCYVCATTRLNQGRHWINFRLMAVGGGRQAAGGRAGREREGGSNGGTAVQSRVYVALNYRSSPPTPFSREDCN